ncbi:Udp-glycosyltransferase 79b30 [Thalictrum thalictroides]|uniref:Glycosyltransferase n=1 Tax=Thalictrum thalictroides TaxID=46969 RepID=A0A7J6VUE6_THATH|nr:Udp-glycosyltransferase 79b30 [Thalictrum thalictroides]
MAQSKLHIAMNPWFAFGHLNAFLHLSNLIAARGHRISFLTPKKAQAKLEDFNNHPDLIKFIPLTVPHVEGLPVGAETTNDVPDHQGSLIMTAMDKTRPEVEAILKDLKPDVVFFDFTYWLPEVTKQLGIKSLQYCITSASTVAYILVRSSTKLDEGQQLTEDELMKPPADFPPSSTITLHRHEARALSFTTHRTYGEGISFHERIVYALRDADGYGFRSCREIEGTYCDYIENHFKKPSILFGPTIPQLPTTPLDENKAKWLGQFKPGSVVFCAFGSECVMEKNNFQELLLGIELTGLPFFIGLKPPSGTETIDEALPEGFKERVQGRGIVEGGWIQQLQIMAHPSVGCFISHGGLSSVTEALVNNTQLVIIPQRGDQYIIARLMSGDMKVAVEVEMREEDGWYSKENVCTTVKSVMDEGNETGKQIRANKLKLKEFLLDENLESTYLDSALDRLKETLLK